MNKPSFVIVGRKGVAATPTCPDCRAPLWMRACKCGWQAVNPFRQPGTTAHEAIEARLDEVPE